MLRFFLILVGLMLLAVIAVLVVALGAAAIGAIAGMRAVRERVGAARLRRKQPEAKADPLDPLEAAWQRAAEEADWAVSRVAAARTSCARLVEIADADPLATDAIDWANVVRRRVPDLVVACFDECAQATPAERRRHLDDLVESLEKIAAEAERRRDRFRKSSVTPFAVQRAYVDQRTRPDSLG